MLLDNQFCFGTIFIFDIFQPNICGFGHFESRLWCLKSTSARKAISLNLPRFFSTHSIRNKKVHRKSASTSESKKRNSCCLHQTTQEPAEYNLTSHCSCASRDRGRITTPLLPQWHALHTAASPVNTRRSARRSGPARFVG